MTWFKEDRYREDRFRIEEASNIFSQDHVSQEKDEEEDEPEGTPSIQLATEVRQGSEQLLAHTHTRGTFVHLFLLIIFTSLLASLSTFGVLYLTAHGHLPAAIRRHILPLHGCYSAHHERIAHTDIYTPPMPALTLVGAGNTYTPFNFAMRQCGAQIVRELSCPDILIPLPLEEPGAILGEDPINMVLDAQSIASRCWEFDGAHGQLAIALSSAVNVSRFSIEHIFSPNSDPHTAPQSMVAWGLVDGEDLLEILATSLDNYQLLRSHLPNGTHPPEPSTNTYLPLAYLEYNVFSSSPTQYFSVFKDLALFDIPIGIVVIQVLSNWGASSTQLCHVGVYGKEVLEGWRL